MKYMNLFAAMLVAALMVVVGCGDSKAPVPPGGPDSMDNAPNAEREGMIGEDPGEEGEEEGGAEGAADGGDEGAAAEGGDEEAAEEGGDEEAAAGGDEG